MSSIFADAHMRMASLPTRRVMREPAERLPTSLVGYPMERRQLGRPMPGDATPRRKAVRSVEIKRAVRAADEKPKRASR